MVLDLKGYVSMSVNFLTFVKFLNSAKLVLFGQFQQKNHMIFWLLP